MPICNPAANPPNPPNIAPIGRALTAAMVAKCREKANDMRVPIGDVERTTTDGVRVVYVTNCHPYTDVIRNGQVVHVPGAFHGCSVWLDTSPVPEPPEPKPGSETMVERKTDWPVAIASGVAVVGVVVAFVWALRATGRKT
jgi:hypothetical protein